MCEDLGSTKVGQNPRKINAVAYKNKQTKCFHKEIESYTMRSYSVVAYILVSYYYLTIIETFSLSLF